jgi:hypothetical protein
MPKISPPSTAETKEIIRSSAAARQLERRLFLKQGLSLGALTLLTGCDVSDTSAVQSALKGISSWNDRVQAALFNSARLMPTYPESQAIKDFRYNAYYGQSQIPKIDGETFKLVLSGLIDSRRPWTLRELYQLPQESQVCVEGWSMIGKWTGVPVRYLPAANRRRPHRQVRRFRMRRRLLFEHRHGLGAASADIFDVQDFGRDSCTQIWLPAQAAHSDQARLQEPEMDHCHLRDQPLPRRFLGGPRLQLVRRCLSFGQAAAWMDQ